MRGNQLDVLTGKALVKSVAVIGFVTNDSHRFAPGAAVLEDLLDEGDFVGRSARNDQGDRKAVAVRNCQDLGPFSALGFTNKSAPFFAGEKVPSMKHSDTSILPRHSRSLARARGMRPRVPLRTQT